MRRIGRGAGVEGWGVTKGNRWLQTRHARKHLNYSHRAITPHTRKHSEAHMIMARHTTTPQPRVAVTGSPPTQPAHERGTNHDEGKNDDATNAQQRASRTHPEGLGTRGKTSRSLHCLQALHRATSGREGDVGRGGWSRRWGVVGGCVWGGGGGKTGIGEARLHTVTAGGAQRTQGAIRGFNQTQSPRHPLTHGQFTRGLNSTPKVAVVPKQGGHRRGDSVPPSGRRERYKPPASRHMTTPTGTPPDHKQVDPEEPFH